MFIITQNTFLFSVFLIVLIFFYSIDLTLFLNFFSQVRRYVLSLSQIDLIMLGCQKNLYPWVFADKIHNEKIDIVNGYSWITDTDMFNIRILMRRVRVS